MASIWKFTLKETAVQDISMPNGARIVHVATQFEKACLWAIVDPQAEKETRRFGIVGTGHSFDESSGDYLGSFMIQGGAFVFHVFEAKP